MTLPDRILTFLAALPDGATDRQIFEAVGAKYYQQVNDRCRRLAARGLIERRETSGVIRNFFVAGTAKPHHIAPSQTAITEKPWFWEGNVQSKVVRYLVESGCDVTRVADTASKEAGKDITARRGQRDIWVSVKGRPQGTERTNAHSQARHWFQGALLDLVLWRGESKDAELVAAFPEFTTYRNLAKRIEWLTGSAKMRIVWIQEDGRVLEE